MSRKSRAAALFDALEGEAWTSDGARVLARIPPAAEEVRQKFQAKKIATFTEIRCGGDFF